ncbi:ABC transporter ATP-binding protein [Oceanobacillus locisalsi]|uniref:ABC transporter ATP-binding protein n=1 Tax=Oceanobacillus locisalsi TaxID=546107 RepID=A0ABW3NMI5_9BACI
MTESTLVDMKKAGKKLGNNIILENVSLEIKKGETIGIVGTNGSGKTTLLRLIAGLSYLSEGELKVMDKQVKPGMMGSLPENIGVLIETPSFINHETGLENLNNLAQIRKKISKQDVKEAIQKVGLDPMSKKKVKQYSLGMKQRLGIAQSLMETPSLVLFDEPTNGLDQEGRELFYKYVQGLKKQGTGYVFVSHHEHEIEAFCDRVLRIENHTLVPLEKEKKISIQLMDSADVGKVLSVAPNSTMEKQEDGKPVMLVPFTKGTDEEIDNFFKEIAVEYKRLKRDHE